MRNFLLSLIFTATSLCLSAQSYNERIVGAINASDWFALDSIYNSAPKDSIAGFLEVYSRGLIGNRLNRPDISIPAFEELLNSHSADFDLQNLLNSAVMLAMDLSRTGDNAKAAAVLTSMLDATRQYLDPAAIGDMQRYIDQYTSLSAYNPYDISFDGATGRVPFRIVPVGPAKHNAVLMHLDNSTINGIEADITFDTGAGVNIISDSLAERYRLIPIDAHNNVAGMGVQKARYAMAREIRIGNVTVRDVPFCVMSLSTDNAEADRFIDCFNIVVGSELMLQLKDLTIDFAGREITIPSEAPARSDTPANMCFSPTMNLLARGAIHGNQMLINIDSGDASFGVLSNAFLIANKDYVISRATTDTIRTAGIGGVHISECYRVPDVAAGLGGNTVILPQIAVRSGENPPGIDYECNLGLKSLMQFGKVRFNMVDFTISTYPTKMSASTPLYNVPSFRATREKGLSLLQGMGIIAVGVGRALINPNAPLQPDL